jgi:hypothetical protein
VPQDKRGRNSGSGATQNGLRNGTAQKLTLSQLESHLWESANILRGPVDAADFKTYIFPLLFFKRISDANDEEYAAALAESGGDEEYARFPQNYRFQVPEGCHWRDVRAVATNVGQALQTALRGIEKANPETLYGIFGDAQWTNKDRLSDALLRDLIEHYSRISLGNEAAEADILGQAYEYLIKKFADLTNKKAGEFYTPRSVVRLMVNILDPHQGETIYDPACGTGGMLLEAIHHVRERREDARTLWGKIFGQEKNLTTSAIARMLFPFVPSHRPAAQVQVTTLRRAIDDEKIANVDFLKIDTEGYDFHVLKGFPWDAMKPEVILCEFEDSKTTPLGYTHKDMADFLLSHGYRVFLSEWFPVLRYGIPHKWRRWAQWPSPLQDEKAWGNFVAFRPDATLVKINPYLRSFNEPAVEPVPDSQFHPS